MKDSKLMKVTLLILLLQTHQEIKNRGKEDKPEKLTIKELKLLTEALSNENHNSDSGTVITESVREKLGRACIIKINTETTNIASASKIE